MLTKNILFIKIGALGDLSYALPAAKLLKHSLSCHLTWVVGKSGQDFLKNHAYIDRLIVVDDKKFYSKNIFIRALELIKLYVKLRNRFDSVLIAHRDAIYYSAFQILSRESIFQLVREDTQKSSQFVYVEPLSTHESVAIKKLVEAAIRFYEPQKDVSHWEWDYSHIPFSTIPLPAQYGVFHLGGGVNSKTEFRLKCWPYWEELIVLLLTQTNLNLVFIGAPSEKETYEKIVENIKKMIPDKMNACFNLIGRTTIPELIDVIRRSDFVVGIDSGPLHIADSLDKTSLGLFGPTSSISWGLLSNNANVLHTILPCSPCYRDDGIFPECQYQNQCMTLLDAHQVFDTLKSQIERRGLKSHSVGRRS